MRMITSIGFSSTLVSKNNAGISLRESGIFSQKVQDSTIRFSHREFKGK